MNNSFKDHFSKQSAAYAKYRPAYPRELFVYLSSLTIEKKIAWDCATGSGQAAVGLSDFFEKVIASDASSKQIESSEKKTNIQYEVFPAEKTNFDNSSINLITVAQAVHWFDFDKFYAEVKRILKSDGIIAVWTYGLLKIHPDIDSIITNFYSNKVGSFWPKERKYIEEEYKTIPFPFNTITTPEFSINMEWDLSDLLGYLRTWSSVQRYIDEKKENPIPMLEEELKSVWKIETDKKKVTWPLYVIAGKQ